MVATSSASKDSSLPWRLASSNAEHQFGVSQQATQTQHGSTPSAGCMVNHKGMEHDGRWHQDPTGKISSVLYTNSGTGIKHNTMTRPTHQLMKGAGRPQAGAGTLTRRCKDAGSQPIQSWQNDFGLGAGNPNKF